MSNHCEENVFFFRMISQLKDTVWDFDDMSNTLPEWGKVSLVPQANLISLHQAHVFRNTVNSRKRRTARELADERHN